MIKLLLMRLTWRMIGWQQARTLRTLGKVADTLEVVHARLLAEAEIKHAQDGE